MSSPERKEDSRDVNCTSGVPGGDERVEGYILDFKEMCVCAALPPK